MNNLGHWCICYKSLKNPDEEKVLRRFNSNGIAVSANKFSQVMRFGTFKEAHDYAKNLVDSEQNYVTKIRKFFLTTNDKFYLG
jgi:hypothetical protein